MFNNNNSSNKSSYFAKKLLPIYQLVVGLVFGNSLVAVLNPPGWVVWFCIFSCELIPVFYSKSSKVNFVRGKRFLVPVQRIRRGFLLAVILDAFRLGS